jgi:hypothetical protein
MATKEELNRIFENALQEEELAVKNSAPAVAPMAAAPMPVAQAVVAPAQASSPAAVATEPVKVVAHASVNETDPEFGALLEEREGRLKKRSTRARWAVNLLLLGIFGGTATAFTVSPTLRGKVEHLVVSLKEGVDDVKMMGKGADNYDEALEEVAARGNQIDAASRALGIDPTTIDPGDDPNMLAEMNELAGEDIGIDTRLGKLQSMGKLGQAITGAEGPKTKEDFAAAAQEAAEAPAQ